MKRSTKSVIGGEPISPELVHKSNIDNILISNLRRPLPVSVDADGFKSKVLPNCTRSEKEVLEALYACAPDVNTAGEFRLNSVEFSFAAEEVKNRLLDKQSKDDIRFFLRNYGRSRNRSNYHLKLHTHENDLNRLAQIMGVSKPSIPDKTKAMISDLLDRCGANTDHGIYYANMIIDTSHYYFFEHPNDHVPGMMMVEAVRQLLVACTHKYGMVPLSNYNFILTSLSGDFKSYLELNQPVLFKVIQKELRTNNTGMWTSSSFEVFVYQNDIECAVLNFQEEVISARLFKRLRNSNRAADVNKWFTIRDNVEYSVVIRGNGLTKTDADIQYLSHHGCILAVDASNDITQITPQEPIEFFMHFSKIGFIHGLADLEPGQQHGDRLLFYFHADSMEAYDKTNLQEVIKKYGYLANEQEQITA